MWAGEGPGITDQTDPAFVVGWNFTIINGVGKCVLAFIDDLGVIVGQPFVGAPFQLGFRGQGHTTGGERARVRVAVFVGQKIGQRGGGNRDIHTPIHQPLTRRNRSVQARHKVKNTVSARIA